MSCSNDGDEGVRGSGGVRGGRRVVTLKFSLLDVFFLSGLELISAK